MAGCCEHRNKHADIIRDGEFVEILKAGFTAFTIPVKPNGYSVYCLCPHIAYIYIYIYMCVCVCVLFDSQNKQYYFPIHSPTGFCNGRVLCCLRCTN
jgi:hypothetical protein